MSVLHVLVEQAYREGFDGCCDRGQRSEEADRRWNESEVKRALEMWPWLGVPAETSTQIRKWLLQMRDQQREFAVCESRVEGTEARYRQEAYRKTAWGFDALLQLLATKEDLWRR